MRLSSFFEKPQGIDRDIVWYVRLLRADDSTSDLENFVLDVIENQFLVFAFRNFTKEILPELLLMCSDRTGCQVEQFSQNGWTIVV